MYAEDLKHIAISYCLGEVEEELLKTLDYITHFFLQVIVYLHHITKNWTRFKRNKIIMDQCSISGSKK